MIRVSIATIAAAVLAGAVAPAVAQPAVPEPVSAVRGGILDWQPGPNKSSIFVQDRRMRWYKVELTGPCSDRFGGEPLIFEGGPMNELDRFSSIRSARNPYVVCGVSAIETSAPPPSRKAVRND